MTSCDLDTSVPDWIIEHPNTWAVFSKLGIDYSCGAKSLEYTCREQGFGPTMVLETLHHCLDNEEQTGRISFTNGGKRWQFLIRTLAR